MSEVPIVGIVTDGKILQANGEVVVIQMPGSEPFQIVFQGATVSEGGGRAGPNSFTVNPFPQ